MTKRSKRSSEFTEQAMFFSEEALKNLADGYAALDGKLDALVAGYVRLTLTKPRARECASQGFPRRLKTMARCIKNVFALIPPERMELPTADELSDATINIQVLFSILMGQSTILGGYGPPHTALHPALCHSGRRCCCL
jgi:hypothetical protein